MRSLVHTVSVVLAAWVVLGCGPRPGPEPRAAGSSASAELGRQLEPFYSAYLEAYPQRAVELGYHEYDGKLPDITPSGLAAEAQRLREARAAFERIEPAALRPDERIERGVVLFAIRSDLFQLEQRDPFRNPQYYVGPLALTPYISRPYAGAAERARAVLRIAEQAPAFLRQAESNLDPNMPRPWIETALKQIQGMGGFVRSEVAPALPGLSPELDAELRAALGGMAQALDRFAAVLEQRLAAADDAFALGEATFLRMLEETQGVRITLPELERMARADLERNLRALETCVREIDPNRPLREVVDLVRSDKPPAQEVLATASAQAAHARAFVAEHGIASIPTADVAETRVTPPYLRYNLAFLDGAGPFERLALPSFYYITPPDPAWPEAKQRDYVPDRWSLFSVTVHEVWPGHFLHSLHVKRQPSRVLRTFGNYAMTEGWAHYAEELMWEQGLDRNPRFRVGQLLMALLRNVRFVSAIGLHARGMTVEQSAALFREQAFQDEGNAQQQAARGTFDPMYLSYTLGKLMILKLRADYRARREAAGEAFSLADFHDRFLSHGSAPIPLIREAMLGPRSD
jgi:uncharacterized protein (DUF885 family)